MALSMSFSVSMAENRVCSPVDEALAGLCFVHSCYEVCRTVGLPELDVVEHTLHVDGKFNRLLRKSVDWLLFVNLRFTFAV